MKTKEQEQLEFIQIVNELNQELYEKNGEVELEDNFYYSTDGDVDAILFGDKVLWHSENDDRKFIEDKNDYEDFKPFIINVFNNWVATIQYKLY